MISESFFKRDVLYERTFQVPSKMKGKRILLNFDGINWKALVVLNGKQVGRIEGAFRINLSGKVALVRVINNRGNDFYVDRGPARHRG